jgi:hypothetical protein
MNNRLKQPFQQDKRHSPIAIGRGGRQPPVPDLHDAIGEWVYARGRSPALTCVSLPARIEARPMLRRLLRIEET